MLYIANVNCFCKFELPFNFIISILRTLPFLNSDFAFRYGPMLIAFFMYSINLVAKNALFDIKEIPYFLVF